MIVNEPAPLLFQSLIPPATQEAIHIGIDDLPFVSRGDGQHTQLLHVDLLQNLVVIRARLEPGFTLPTHYHAGMVLAVTTQGSWYYAEYPESVNKPGSYLFEPAGSVHTLTVPKDQEGETIVWFAVFGSSIDIGRDGQIEKVTDANVALRGYRAACAAKGLNCDKLIVVGETV
jgi:2,4'-dihydroxyacetophenone dioxygenase